MFISTISNTSSEIIKESNTYVVDVLKLPTQVINCLSNAQIVLPKFSKHASDAFDFLNQRRIEIECWPNSKTSRG